MAERWVALRLTHPLTLFTTRGVWLPGRGGFTLVEIVAVIVVLGVIGAGVSSIILTATNGYAEAATRSQLHRELSTALDRLCVEFRQIELDPAASQPAPHISSLDAVSIAWNGDQSLLFDQNRLLYTDSSVNQALLLEDVSGFTLTALDDSDHALSPPLSAAERESIRRIRIDLTLTREGVSESLRGKVFLRSLMSGAGGGA